jgi:hypothetical protein
MPVTINPETTLREFAFFNRPAEAANASSNYTAPIIYGKNARGYSTIIPKGNIRRIVADPEGLSQRIRANKETLRTGIHVPIIRELRDIAVPEEKYQSAVRKNSVRKFGTYRNTGVNTTNGSYYLHKNAMGYPMNELMRKTQKTIERTSLPFERHARLAARFGELEAEEIAREAAERSAAARGLTRRSYFNTGVLPPRSKSVPKMRKTRKARRN